MFYYLAEFRDVFFGLNIFRYITFRAGMAAITTFLLCMVFGPVFTRLFRKYSIREKAKRDDCPDLDQFQGAKEGVPTMGGILIIGSIVVSVLLWGNLTNSYILMTLFVCVFLAGLGAVDDYIKLTQKGRRGLRVKTKLLWQVLLGCFVGSYIFFSSDPSTLSSVTRLDVPFCKKVITLGLFYIPFVAMVLISTCNSVNVTDGLDGLAIGCVLIVSVALAVLCYVSGHIKIASYLFIPFIEDAGELTVFCAAILGASLGFLWFNSHPATIFMGDTGSLALGGTIGMIAVFIKKELWLFLLGGVFVIEALSVIAQVLSVKLRRKRLFKVSPIHHHLQLCGWHESKIIIRFWIIGIIMALLTLTMLKIR